MGECGQQKHIQHALSTKTECDYLYGWIKRRVTYAKISPKRWWNPVIQPGVGDSLQLSEIAKYFKFSVVTIIIIIHYDFPGVGPVLSARQGARPDHLQDPGGEPADLPVPLQQRLRLAVPAAAGPDVWAGAAGGALHHQQNDHQRGAHGQSSSVVYSIPLCVVHPLQSG